MLSVNKSLHFFSARRHGVLLERKRRGDGWSKGGEMALSEELQCVWFLYGSLVIPFSGAWRQKAGPHERILV
jgi:hypothetical protein